jgi:hypothetical protein
MSALLENGLEVTALHNHFFWETPRVFYMHIHGHGNAAELAEGIKPALDLIGKGKPAQTTPATAAGANPKTSLDTAQIAKIVGHEGELNGAVYKITVGRDDLKLKEMGAVINARMGLNTWAAFYGTNDEAAVAGDVAMLEREVTPTLKALRAHGLDVVAIHHHMTGTPDRRQAAPPAARERVGKTRSLADNPPARTSGGPPRGLSAYIQPERLDHRIRWCPGAGNTVQVRAR